MSFTIQELFDTFSKMDRCTRGGYHVTLGSLIKALQAVPADMPVVFSDDAIPGEFDSYRGYYADLALERGKAPVTAGEFLAKCENALGKEFTGYKGGEFLMGPDTPLWRAEYGDCGEAIVAAAVTGGRFVLTTKFVE